MHTAPSQEAFFALLRSGLYGTEPQALPEGADWKAIVAMAKKQGVTGLVYDAAMRMPDLPPERIAKIRALSIMNVQTHVQLDNAVAQVVDMYESHGVHGVLLKGQGVARYYREPMTRHCGDIDFYVGKKAYAHATELAREYLMDGDGEESEQHLNFRMGRAIVEVHRIASTIYSPVKGRRFQEWVEWELEHSPTRRKAMIGGREVTLPSYDFDAIYIFYHAWRHFYTSGIGLRQLCDWAMVFHTNFDNIDIGALKANIKRFGLTTGWKLFACIAVERLGLDPVKMPLYDANYSQKSQKILERILAGGNFGHYFADRPRDVLPGIRQKLRTFRAITKNSCSLFPYQPLEAVSYWMASTTYGIGKYLRENLKR